MVIQVLKSAKENRLRRHHHHEKKDNRLSSRSSNSLEYKHNYNIRYTQRCMIHTRKKERDNDKKTKQFRIINITITRKQNNE